MCQRTARTVWKTGSYRLKIFYNEIKGYCLREEYENVKTEKRKLQNEVDLERAKRLCVEEELDRSLEENQRQENFYKRKFKQVVLNTSKKERKDKTRGLDKKKAFSDYLKRHQNRIKKKAKEECQATLAFLELYNYVPIKVEVLNEQTNNYETQTLNLIDEDFETPCNSPKEINDIDNLNTWLYLKDKFQISNEAWREISKHASDVPNLYNMEKWVQLVNSKWSLKPTPGDTEGIQISFVESLEENIRQLKANQVINDKDTTKVKLSGDGTNIGKRLTLENVTYTILNENNVAMSEKGNYVLAIIKMKEDYENLRIALQDLRDEMKNLKEITVDGNTYKLEYF